MSESDQSIRVLGILEKLKQNCNMQASAHAYLRDDWTQASLTTSLKCHADAKKARGTREPIHCETTSREGAVRTGATFSAPPTDR
jgi:hypothetical protein